MSAVPPGGAFVGGRGAAVDAGRRQAMRQAIQAALDGPAGQGTLIAPPAAYVRGPWVVLDRVVPGWTPPYCTHGKATCLGCGEWCWLGNKTAATVQSGQHKPLCMQCAEKHADPASRMGRVDDHLRTDGPHEEGTPQ